MESVLEIG